MPGCFPLTKAVANAIANRPQSLPPACFCTFIMFTVVFSSGQAIIAAICRLTFVLIVVYILSYTNTSVGLVASMVLIVSQ